MKKKIIVWVIITSVLFSSAFADASVTFQCSVVRDGFKQTATAELVSIKNEPYIISSFFPQKAIQVDSAMQSLLFSEKPFLFLSTSCLHNALHRFDETLLLWLNELPAEQTSGIFTGNLFETAFNKRSSDFMLDYFQQFLMKEKTKYTQKKTTDSTEVSYIIILSYMIEKIRQISGDDHLLVRSGQYDNSYLSFNIMSGQKTVMTVSADISERDKRKILISFRENEQFRFIQYDILMDENHISIHTNQFLFSQPYSEITH